MAVRVLIVEDEVTLRETIADLIRSESSLELVGAAQDVQQAMELATEHQPAVALVDVKMPQGGGPRATREMRRSSPATRVLALSAFEDTATVLQMLRAGAAGYLLKAASAEEILAGVHRCAEGEVVLSPKIAADIVKELLSLLDRSDEMARRLADLDRIKSELIAILSHELRTPLTVIMGTVPMLTRDPGQTSVEELREMGAAMQRATTRLNRVALNVTVAAELELEGMRKHRRPVVVAEIVKTALDEFRYERERFLVSEDLRNSGWTVWGDSALAVRALVTVMENAAEFSPEKAQVEIGVQGDEERTSIVVSDRGPGIPKEKRESVFAAFSQVDSSTARSHEGMGIGLYLARLIMDAHQGSIRVAARDGGGSSFFLTFPTAPLPAPGG